MIRRRAAIVAGTALAATGVAVPAIAYWTLTSNSSSGTFTNATLANPTATSVTATQTSPTAVSVAWTAPTNPSGTVYAVTRTTDGTVICAGVSASPCSDTSPLPGVVNAYSVQAKLPTPSTWVAAGTAPTASTAVALPDTFSVATKTTLGVATTTPTAGTAFNVILTAQKWNGTAIATDTNFTGAKTIGYTGPGTSPAPVSQQPSYTTGATFTSGVSNALATTLYRAEATTITATTGTGNSAVGGNSSGLTVSASSTQALNYTGSSMNNGTSSNVSCAAGGTLNVGNFGTFTSAVSITDPWANPMTNGSSAVTISMSSNPALSGTSGGHNVGFTTLPSPFQIAANANPATTASTFTFTRDNATSSTVYAVKATAGSLNVTCNIAK